MNIVLPSGALKLILPQKRWIVYQATIEGKVVYADTFISRGAAERAAKVANERTRKFLSSRLPAEVKRLPHDIR